MILICLNTRINIIMGTGNEKLIQLNAEESHITILKKDFLLRRKRTVPSFEERCHLDNLFGLSVLAISPSDDYLKFFS